VLEMRGMAPRKFLLRPAATETELHEP
jgi:hypothetical protein